jgi:ubiquinone/menaquinone biosynthesis C-methylase UbiE
MATGNLSLLPSQALVRTGPVDHADWNYRPVLGWIQRLRFRLIQSLLPRTTVQRLLEVGYGCGIFMPTLAQYCNELHGIDIHDQTQPVTEQLAKHQVTAQLVTGTAEALPYADQFFDTIIAVSSLEFIENIEQGTTELRRVLQPAGQLILVTPGQSPILDWGLKLLTGESAKSDYADRRGRLMPALQTAFSISEQRCFPRWVPGIKMYQAYAMRKKS